MRVETVNAIAFGSLRGASLEFPPGLAVVYGPNESGKSTWLHAVFCALCGITPGKRPGDVARFEDRYAPWFEDEWKVSAVVSLDDGRRLEVVQNLRKKSGFVTDLTTGKDVTAEFTRGRKRGMPDLTTACGVDRDFFRHVGIVRQGSVLDLVRDGPPSKKGGSADSIRTFLERASAVSGAPSGIAEAVRRLELARDALGQEGRGGSKPLNVAGLNLREAEAELEGARRAHDELVSCEKLLKDLEARESELGSRIAFFKAVLARAEAVDFEERLSAASELAEKHPELQAGEWAEAVDRQRKIAEARTSLANAVEEWESLPAMSEDEIRKELAEVEGAESFEDLSIDPQLTLASLGDLHAFYRQAYEAFSVLKAAATEIPAPPDLGRATPIQLEQLAIKASAEPPPVHEGLKEALEMKELQLSRAASRRGLLVAGSVLGAVLVLAGVAILFGSPVKGAVVAIVGLAMLASSLMALSASGAGGRELHRLRMLYGTHVEAAERTRRQVAAALQEAAELGLPATTEGLRDLAEAWKLYEIQRRGSESIEEHLDSARSKLIEEAAALAARLEELRDEAGLGALEIPSFGGAPQASVVDTDALKRLEQGYETAARYLRHAADSRDRERKRRDLERVLSARQRLSAAVQAGVEALKATSIEEPPGRFEGDPAALLAALDTAAQTLQKEARTVGDIQRRFAALTGGRSLEDLRSDVKRAVRRADESEALLSESERARALSMARSAASAEDVVAEYENELEELERELAEVSGKLAAERRAFEIRFGSGAPAFVSVAQAEERVEEKRREYERLKERAFAYEKAAELLRAAEQRIHNVLAPRLQSVAGELTEAVTLSRYKEVFVDDERPVVRVRRLGAGGETGQAIEAEMLSYGTAEQIYLVFRLVVANTAATKESIPMILDESTVYADSERLGRLLAILKGAAEDDEPFDKISQVILFTQEDEVVTWAKENLPEANVIELGGP